MRASNEHFRRGLFAALFIALCGSAIPASAQNIDEIVNGQMTRRHIPGLSVAVVKDGKVVTTKGYGLANVELEVPATENTVYQLASVTKQFTATGIMLLVQDGKLGLDDKISGKLTGLPAAWNDVTVRQLLTHTSGIKNYTEVEGFDRHAREEMSNADVLKLVSDAPLDFPSGSKFHYSNTGFFLLGMIIEKVAGKSYGDFLAERIFKPLGMNSTRFNDINAVIKQRAAGYTYGQNALRNANFVSPSQPFAAGGLISTVVDMTKWDAALNDERLLPRAVLESMWMPAKLTDGSTTKYGFGWGVSDQGGHRMIAHTGGIDGFSTVIMRFPTDKLTVIVLANSDGAQAERVALEIAASFIPSVKEAPKPVIADTMPESTAKLRAFLERAAAGKYETTEFTEDGQKFFFPDRIKQLTGFLGSIGTIKTMELIEDEDRGDVRRRRYRVTGETGSALIGFVIDKEGKIGGIGINPG